MLINFYQPNALNAKKLDQMLSKGWFRSGSYLYKSKLICLDEEMSDIINVRLNILEHKFTKTQRKLLRKNDKNFRIVTKPLASISEAKNRLYQNSKGRFRGFLMDSLNYFLNFSVSKKLYNTYEICVYDGKKLIAISFFDLGNNSISSLLALKDWDYATFSLNKYTMLKEIEFGKKYGCQHYYPGYILSHSDAFDYKVDIGKFQYLDEQKKWQTFKEKIIFSNSVTELLKAKTNQIEEKLSAQNKKVTTFIYPLHSFSNDVFESFTNTTFLEAPIFVFENFNKNHNYFFVHYYNIIEDYFVKCKVKIDERYQFTDELFSNKSQNNNLTFNKLLAVATLISKSRNLNEIV